MSSPTPVTYLFCGQDELTLREQLAAFCNEMSDPATADLNTTRFQGATAQIADISAAAGALPFLADLRLVLVENLTDSANGRALIEPLPEVLTRLPDTTRLIFVETGLTADSPADSPAERKHKAARTQTLKKLVNIVENDPRGRVLVFDMPRDTVGWVVARAGRHNAAIEPAAAQQLLERTADNLVLIDSELAKLAAYAGGQRPITAGDVALLTPYTPEANVFHMVDALGQRQGETALRLLRKLLDDGDEPLRIFVLIVRQFRLLLLFKEQVESGRSVSQAAQALKVQEFVARKLSAQARQYSLELLERVYRHLLEVDLEMKTGQVDPELALEVLVARLTARG